MFYDLCFIVYFNDLCNVNKHSKYLLFVHDIKIFRVVFLLTIAFLLQTETERMQGWCTVNFKKLNTSNSRVIPFTEKN
jgi:hypothetical protein